MTGGQEVASSSLVTPTSNGDVAFDPRISKCVDFFVPKLIVSFIVLPFQQLKPHFYGLRRESAVYALPEKMDSKREEKRNE